MPDTTEDYISNIIGNLISQGGVRLIAKIGRHGIYAMNEGFVLREPTRDKMSQEAYENNLVIWHSLEDAKKLKSKGKPTLQTANLSKENRRELIYKSMPLMVMYGE